MWRGREGRHGVILPTLLGCSIAAWIIEEMVYELRFRDIAVLALFLGMVSCLMLFHGSDCVNDLMTVLAPVWVESSLSMSVRIVVGSKTTRVPLEWESTITPLQCMQNLVITMKLGNVCNRT